MVNDGIVTAGWKELCQTGFRETDPTKAPGRIADARNAVLNRIEDLLRRPVCAEHQALKDALRGLGGLQGKM
jgi:hypothetical protein